MTLRLLALPLIAVLAACQNPADEGGAGVTEETLPKAVIETDMGEIRIVLHAGKAPVSVANFLAHVEAGTFEGGSFYRVVRDDNDRPDIENPMNLIQGGWGFEGLPEAQGIAHESTDMTGLSHVRGAVSMGRYDVGTATTEFFIMLNDTPGLDAGPDGRNPGDEAGYAVFGQVVEGIEIAEAIMNGAAGGHEGAPEGFAHQFLTEPVTIRSIRRVR
ncbi:peptidylprolyl isomerase [Alkalicaulis satelles]|nr:peptidylprolyl isomerase [Alkalicaulis satelles]